MKLVSVVIPTYGRAEHLKQAIESVLNQSYSKTEIIVVDDNPPQSSVRDKVQSIIKGYQTLERVFYIPLEKNSGGSVARNTGIEFAHGEYIAFLDDDDFFLPDYLKYMVAEIEGKEPVDVVYEAQWYVSTGKVTFCSKKQPDKIGGDIWEKVLGGDVPMSIFLLFKKEAAIKIGLFDPSLRAYDDFDLWLRWSRKLKFGCVTMPLAVVRRERGKSLTFDIDKMERGLKYIEEKWTKKLNLEEQRIFQRFFEKHFIKLEEKQLFISDIKNKQPCVMCNWKLIQDYIKDKRIRRKHKLSVLSELCLGDKALPFKVFFFRFRYRILR